MNLINLKTPFRMIFFLGILMLSSCTFYRIKTVPVDEKMQKKVVDPKNYVVVHHKDEVKHLETPQILVQDGTIVSNVKELAENRSYHKLDSPSKVFPYKKSEHPEASPVEDVHLYVDTVRKMDINGIPHYSIKMDNIINAEEYKFAFATSFWWLILIWCTVGLIPLFWLGWIISSMFAS